MHAAAVLGCAFKSYKAAAAAADDDDDDDDDDDADDDDADRHKLVNMSPLCCRVSMHVCTVWMPQQIFLTP
jgi:hypothetical protein